MQRQTHETKGRARRIVVLATAIAVCGLGAPKAAHAQFPFPFPTPRPDPTITVIGDSIIASGLPSGRTTVTATRPDTVSGSPVTIGKFVGTASLFQPFTVNTTAPSFFRPTGDCWQKGALQSAITPDLLQGDKLTFAGSSIFGQPPSTTITVGAATGTPGPAPVCKTLAPFARNAVTGAPTSAGASVALAGVAQPFATKVSLTASDGSHTTDAVEATPDSGGKWSATVQLGSLAAGTVTVTPVFTVPDVNTGATAHVAGPKITLTKS